MGTTYTEAGGLTPAAKATQQLSAALAAITGMPPEELQTAAYSAQLNQPAVEQQTQQDLTQQTGIPGLQSKQQDLGKIFDMYLADQGLSRKYMNTNDTNPYTSPLLAAGATGNSQIGGQATTTAVNPYLNATPEQIVASTQVSDGAFATPEQNTAAMTMLPNATTKLLDTIQTAITGQQGLVKTKMGDVSQNYQARMGVLQSLIDSATKKAGTNRNTGFNKNGDLVDLNTGEIIKSYGGSTNEFGKSMSEEAIGYIDSIKPKISWSNVGPAGKTLGNIPGTSQYGFAQEVEGLKANLRVTTLNQLKQSGGTMGQLSNEEGRALESAIGKLDIGNNPDDFKKQLEKIENYLVKAYTPATGSVNNSSNPQSSKDTVSKKLKAAGYNDAQINEYIKVKGL